jgi:hypothetical protein
VLEAGDGCVPVRPVDLGRTSPEVRRTLRSSTALSAGTFGSSTTRRTSARRKPRDACIARGDPREPFGGPR